MQNPRMKRRGGALCVSRWFALFAVFLGSPLPLVLRNARVPLQRIGCSVDTKWGMERGW